MQEEQEYRDDLQEYIRKYREARLHRQTENAIYSFLQILRKVIERRKAGEEIPFLPEMMQRKIQRYKRISLHEADTYIALLSEYLYRQQKGILSREERRRKLGLA